MNGGKSGAKRRFTLTRDGAVRELPSKISGIDLKRGDIIRLDTSGGGWSDPSARDPEAAKADIAAGYVTGR